MDGGSSDKSVEIIRKYAQWLTYWISEKDNGQSHAINKGFERATGQIMAWLNSDDVYAPGTLELVAKQLVDKSNAMLIGASIISNEQGLLTGTYDRRRPSYAEMLYDARTFPQPSVFWTRDLWEHTGTVDESLYFVLDYEYWLRMRPNVKTEIFVDDILSYARSHGDQKGANWQIDRDVHDRFARQRVYAAINAAHRLGQAPMVWLARSWMRRFLTAWRTRNLSRLKPTVFHRVGLRGVLLGIDRLTD